MRLNVDGDSGKFHFSVGHDSGCQGSEGGGGKRRWHRKSSEERGRWEGLPFLWVSAACRRPGGTEEEERFNASLEVLSYCVGRHRCVSLRLGIESRVEFLPPL